MEARDDNHLTFSQFKDKIIFLLLGSIGWWLWTVSNKANEYALQRAVIDRRLDELENKDGNVLVAIRENTKAIMDMRIQVERMLVIKPGDVFRKVEEVQEQVDELIKKIAGRGPPDRASSIE